jgi:hypothetical protein
MVHDHTLAPHRLDYRNSKTQRAHHDVGWLFAGVLFAVLVIGVSLVVYLAIGYQ